MPMVLSINERGVYAKRFGSRRSAQPYTLSCLAAKFMPWHGPAAADWLTSYLIYTGDYQSRWVRVCGRDATRRRPTLEPCRRAFWSCAAPQFRRAPVPPRFAFASFATQLYIESKLRLNQGVQPGRSGWIRLFTFSPNCVAGSSLTAVLVSVAAPQVFPAIRFTSVVLPEGSRINGGRRGSTSLDVSLPTPSSRPTCA